MQGHKRIGSIAAAAACAVAGGAIGISQSAAATNSSAHVTKKSTTHALPNGAHPNFGAEPGGPGGGAVHSVAEVLDKAGTAYISQTTDSGTIKSVDTTADTITLKEGTSTVTYATPTITIDSSADVTLNGSKSSLSALAAGDHVTITSSSDGTSVFATDSSFHPAQGPGGWGGSGAHGSPPSGSSAG